MARFTDVAFEQGEDGIFDFVIDEDARDLSLSEGLEAAFLVSLFSDRRASAEEVGDPMKRRGWIGNLVAEVPDDNHGSGLWLYEQHRLTQDVVVEVKAEAVQCLEWLAEQVLVGGVSASVINEPAKRQLTLQIAVTEPTGSETLRAYRLADATRNGILARL